MDRDNAPKSRLPHVTTHQAVAMATRLFDLQVTAVEDLSGFDDKNFYLRGTLKTQEERNVLSSNKEFILKIANEVDSSDECFIATQLGVMTFLNARGFKCTTPVPSVLGTPYVMCKIPRRDYPGVIALETHGVHNAAEIYNGEEYSEDEFFVCAVRLLNYVPGKVLKQISLSNKVLFEVGKAVGRMNRELKVNKLFSLVVFLSNGMYVQTASWVPAVYRNDACSLKIRKRLCSRYFGKQTSRRTLLEDKFLSAA